MNEPTDINQVILDKLKELADQIEENHSEVMERLIEVDIALNNLGINIDNRAWSYED